MRALPKNHIYNLFFEKESQYLMVFRNNRTYSIMLGLQRIVVGAVTLRVRSHQTMPLRTGQAGCSNGSSRAMVSPSMGW